MPQAEFRRRGVTMAVKPSLQTFLVLKDEAFATLVNENDARAFYMAFKSRICTHCAGELMKTLSDVMDDTQLLESTKKSTTKQQW